MWHIRHLILFFRDNINMHCSWSPPAWQSQYPLSYFWEAHSCPKSRSCGGSLSWPLFPSFHKKTPLPDWAPSVRSFPDTSSSTMVCDSQEANNFPPSFGIHFIMCASKVRFCLLPRTQFLPQIQLLHLLFQHLILAKRRRTDCIYCFQITSSLAHSTSFSS